MAWFKKYKEEITVEKIGHYMGRLIVLCQGIQTHIEKILERRGDLAEDFLNAYQQKIRDPVYLRELQSQEFANLKREEDDILKLLALEGLLEYDLKTLASEFEKDKKRFGGFIAVIELRYPSPSTDQATIISSIRNSLRYLNSYLGVFDKTLPIIGECLIHERETEKLEKALKGLLDYENVVKMLDRHRIKKWEAKQKMDVDELRQLLEKENSSMDNLKAPLSRLIGIFTDLQNEIEKLQRSGLPASEIPVGRGKQVPGMRLNLIGNLTRKQRRQLSKAGKNVLKGREGAMLAIPKPFASQRETLNAYGSLSNEPWLVKSFQMGGKLHNIKHINEDAVRNVVNSVFGLGLSDGNRGEYGDVYVVLTGATRTKAAEKLPSGRGILYSYGQAHKDAAARRNYHHFVVEGNYVLLQEVLLSFIDNPMNLREFVRLAFGWRNEQERRFDGGRFGNGSQNDLFEDMKKLITYSLKTGVREVPISQPSEQTPLTVRIVRPNPDDINDPGRTFRIGEFVDGLEAVAEGLGSKSLTDDKFVWYIGGIVGTGLAGHIIHVGRRGPHKAGFSRPIAQEFGHQENAKLWVIISDTIEEDLRNARPLAESELMNVRLVAGARAPPPTRRPEAAREPILSQEEREALLGAIPRDPIVITSPGENETLRLTDSLTLQARINVDVAEDARYQWVAVNKDNPREFRILKTGFGLGDIRRGEVVDPSRFCGTGEHYIYVSLTELGIRSNRILVRFT